MGQLAQASRANLSRTLKKTAQVTDNTALIALDEFAVQSVPYTHYAWATKNTKPRIFSDERHRQKMNGFLTVDVQRGTTHVEIKAQSTTEEAIIVIALTVLIYLQKGINQLTFLLDNARIHGKRMEAGVKELLDEIAQQITLPVFSLSYWHTPSYSPQLNPAEYIIHEVRRNGLYNVPCSLTLREKTDRIQDQLARSSPMTEQQMKKLISFIARYKVR
jgi:transposase